MSARRSTKPSPDVIEAQRRLHQQFDDSFPFYADQCLKIRTKKGTIIPLELNRAQLYIHERAEAQLKNRGYVRMILLKGRQQGASTYIEARYTWKVTRRRGVRAYILTHEQAATDNLFEMTERYYEHLPAMVKPVLGSSNAKELSFDRLDSAYKVGTAGNKGAGRSSTLQYLHGCLAEGTPILTPNYTTKPIEDFEVGDLVVTHTGQVASISFISSQKKQCKSIVFRGLGKFPLEATGEHRFYTKKGWKELNEISIGDEIGFPFPKIAGTKKTIGVDVSPPEREQKGGRWKKPSRSALVANEGFGRVLGLFLAEGTIIHQAKMPHYPSAVNFSVHEKEVDRTLAWLKPFSDVYSSVSVRANKNSKTRQVIVYGRSFARTIESLCRNTDAKRLPESWWDYSRDFCKGLFHGYMDGDGNISQDRRLRATSVRQRLTLEMRSLAASLGYGWAGVGYKAAATRGGRNERESFTFELCGVGVNRYCKENDLPVIEKIRSCVTSTSPNAAATTQLSDGYAWVRVRSISDAGMKQVYDFEVAHEDHSYCTIHCATHNSEVAFWPHAEEHAAGLMQAIPKGDDAKGTEIFLESTANGIGNYFHEQWVQAEQGKSDFEAVFVPWYWDHGYRLDRDITLDDDEAEHAKLYGLDLQQMAWRREKIAELGPELFKQEYPVTPAEAFRAAADAAFITTTLIERARKTEADPFGAPVLGVDVARFGDDRTTFAFREGRKVHWVKARSKYSTMDTVGEVVQLHRQIRFKRIFVDVIGVGAGVVDRLIELGLGNVVVAVNSSERAIDDKHYYNKRTEMWGEFREWLKNGPCQIPDEDDLAAEVGAVQYKFDSNGRWQLEKKEDMKKRILRSPDKGDAIVLTFAEPVQLQDGAASYEPSDYDDALGGEYYEPDFI
tara:strand:+ start:1201 stop:3894 length:2694 start_codon:yes stop_codon:yes gene_type:complete